TVASEISRSILRAAERRSSALNGSENEIAARTITSRGFVTRNPLSRKKTKASGKSASGFFGVRAEPLSITGGPGRLTGKTPGDSRCIAHSVRSKVIHSSSPAIPATLLIYALEASQTQTNAQEAFETNRP